jgi:uncharacterized protein
VSSKVRGVPRISFYALCLLVCLLSVCLSGCDKIKSRVHSFLHSNHTSKTRPSPHPSRATPSGPRLAIILDDVGAESGAIDSIFALHFPLTLSVLPNHPHSSEIAQEAHRRGFQVMLHLPMESVANERAESQELQPGMSKSEIGSALNSMLRTVPFAVGVNNHQGSLATANNQLMSELMPVLRTHQLFFIDSRTTAATVAYDSAQSAGVPCAFRNVPFLDDVQEVGAIRRQLELAAKDARQKGQAIAIGHPHPATLRALAEFLPRAEAEGIQLVHASDLVR